ncbi:MAG: aspartate/glutamate racemase family protein [Ancrocorticia sp.]|uniref:aspartate/glutamate racemase family protein n=1 Tax=Ancrocorticia sp. TaxID=2593684 RepID=UPI003F932AF4
MKATLGILGGMGPAATAEFLREFTLQTPADRDQDHFPSISLSDPTVPDRTEAILAGPGEAREKVAAQLRADCEKLISWGAAAIACPCNTAHYFLRQFQDELSVPIVDIIDATADQAFSRAHQSQTASESFGAPTAWLTSTRGTMRTGLYQDAAAARGLELLVPEDSYFDEFSAIIALVKSGDMDEAGARWREVYGDLTGQHDIPILTACTELPLAHAASGLPGKNEVSSLKSLAYSTLKTLGAIPLARSGVDPI